MTKKFVFDIDGTLTPSRKKMDADFADFFKKFCDNNLVYFVTGSDKPKTIEQIGETIFNSAQLSFNCAGNEVWRKTELIYSSDWAPGNDLVEYLNELLHHSKFSEKAGNNIEFRKGMINFSIPGRKCTPEQRELYKTWDATTKERINLYNTIKNNFDYIDIYIGGETGLDIFKKGCGKAQAITKIREAQTDVLYYFGDQIFPSGNDYDAAVLCDRYVNVSDWRDTYHYLLTMD